MSFRGGWCSWHPLEYLFVQNPGKWGRREVHWLLLCKGTLQHAERLGFSHTNNSTELWAGPIPKPSLLPWLSCCLPVMMTKRPWSTLALLMCPGKVHGNPASCGGEDSCGAVLAIHKICSKGQQWLLRSPFRVTSSSSSQLLEHLCTPIYWIKCAICPCTQMSTALSCGAAQATSRTLLPFHLDAIASKSKERILVSLWFCLFAIQSLYSFQNWLLLGEGASCMD